MKATELMIGNWVYLPDMSTGKEYPARLDENFIYDAKYAEPIPLTPEILEKNGFKGDGYLFLEIDDFSYLEYYPFEHRLRKWWHGVDEWENHSETKDITFQCNCHYVHELQNALKLCKIEKEIEL